MTFRKPTIDRVTGISVLVLAIVAFVVIRVLTAPEGSFTADQKTMVIQGALSALALLGGFWLNGTPADKPRGTTTTTTAPTVTTTTTDSPEPTV